MRWSSSVRTAVLLGPLLASACVAQQLIGYVPRRDANVTGASDDLDGQAVLAGAVSVAAKDHTAPIKLTRGGTVRVCQASALKITESREVAVAAPLLFSLDQGAIEIDTSTTPSDSIMTADLRFTIRNSGPLDLRMRVSRNGDTCVENRGAEGPTLAVSDPFGEAVYELAAGQHVLFQHGSVRDVVEHETVPCGCPEPGSSVAEALVAPGSTRTGRQAEPLNAAATQHPFPIAQSGGLVSAPVQSSPDAPPPPPPETPQISDALSYSAATKNPDQPARDANPVNVTAAPVSPVATAANAPNGAIPAAPAPVAPAAPAVAHPVEQPPVNDVVHIVARLFRKLF
jgi:hypothetical protein